MTNLVIPVAGNKTLGSGDDGTLQRVNAAATITIPKETTFRFLDDDQIFIESNTTSLVSIAAEPGVTLETLGGALNLTGDTAFVTLRKISTDLWIAWGDFANSASSSFIGIGSFEMHQNVTFTTINAADTYTDVTGTATVGTDGNNFTFATAPNTLTYTGVNTVKTIMRAQLSLSKFAAAFDSVRVAIFKNGTEITGANNLVSVNNNNISLSISVTEQLATNDAIKIQIKNVNNANNILVSDMNLLINEI